ncbi:MAG: hypothetical protein WBY22_09200 [Nitrososphaeraceae archaeon]
MPLCKRRWTVFIEGPNREMDWAMAEDEETWKVMNETLNSVDALILGRRMYPGYEQYWLSLLANSSIGTENEKAYARRADKNTPYCSLQDSGQSKMEDDNDRS